MLKSVALAFGLIAHVLGQGSYIAVTEVGSLSLKEFSGCPISNDFNYHNSKTQSIRSFQGVFGSNFNETITFCDYKVKRFELNDWKIVPVLGQSADSGQPRYNEKGAMLTGGTFLAPNGSVVWKGFGFSANGPYDCAFALSGNGSEVGRYTCSSDSEERRQR